MILSLAPENDFFSFPLNNGEKIVFEVDCEVSKEKIEGPKILVKFSKPLPSKEELGKLIDILRSLEDLEIPKFKFKIFSFAHYKFFTLKELTKFKEMLRN